MTEGINTTGINTTMQHNQDLIDRTLENREDIDWGHNLKDQILNSSKSNSDVYDVVLEAFTGEETSPARQQLALFLLNQRQQESNLISNLIKMIFDGGNRIISNIRS